MLNHITHGSITESMVRYSHNDIKQKSEIKETNALWSADSPTIILLS